MDVALPACQPLTFRCAAQFLTGHRLVAVHGMGVGDLCIIGLKVVPTSLGSCEWLKLNKRRWLCFCIVRPLGYQMKKWNGVNRHCVRPNVISFRVLRKQPLSFIQVSSSALAAYNVTISVLEWTPHLSTALLTHELQKPSVNKQTNKLYMTVLWRLCPGSVSLLLYLAISNLCPISYFTSTSLSSSVMSWIISLRNSYIEVLSAQSTSECDCVWK